MSTDLITKLCIPWIQHPYRHPSTGKKLTPESDDYRKLSKLCSRVINFDLLELTGTSVPKHNITVSPIVSFLSAAFISQYCKQIIYHPYRESYRPQTDVESCILDRKSVV